VIILRGKPLADWNGLVLPKIREQLDDFNNQGIVPTLRGMFYTLIEIGVIRKDQRIYKALSNHTARWREVGTLRIDCFADHSRGVVKDFNDNYVSIERYIDLGIIHIENARHGYRIPRWYKQPYHVEVWLEKDAPVASIASIVKGRDVLVVPNRGHSSVTFLNDNIDRLKRKQSEGKLIIILYLGDADPSGEIMDKVYKRKLEEYGIFDVIFIRLAVTKVQIDRFNLLHDPDPETLRKLKADPNKESFKRRYGLKSDDELFAVQLEAMFTPSVRSYTKNLLIGNIDQYFDNDIYERVQAERPAQSKVDGLVLSKIKELERRLGLKLT
jgi:hypothetical protein